MKTTKTIKSKPVKLHTVEPDYSVGIMAEKSTGIEPMFALAYLREERGKTLAASLVDCDDELALRRRSHEYNDIVA